MHFYEMVYSQLRSDIVSHKLRPLDRLPSEKHMAEQFGVSKITITRALQMLVNDGFIVRQQGKGSFVAEVPNSSPLTATKPEKHMIIGFVIDEFDSSYGLELLKTMGDLAFEHEAFLIIIRSRSGQPTEEMALERLRQLGVNGLIVYPVSNEFYNPMIMRLHLEKVPMVLVDKSLSQLPIPAVTSDNYEAAYALTKHLMDLGHRKIGFASWPPDGTSSITDRFNGYLRAIADGRTPFGLDWCVRLPAEGSFETLDEKGRQVRETLRRFLHSHPEVTAIVASQSNFAETLLEIAESEGRKVPGDLSIVCFDLPQKSRQFTHVKQNEAELARMSFNLLMQAIRGEDLAGRSFVVPSSLIVGTTSGPVSADIKLDRTGAH